MSCSISHEALIAIYSNGYYHCVIHSSFRSMLQRMRPLEHFIIIIITLGLPPFFHHKICSLQQWLSESNIYLKDNARNFLLCDVNCNHKVRSQDVLNGELGLKLKELVLNILNLVSLDDMQLCAVNCLLILLLSFEYFFSHSHL